MVATVSESPASKNSSSPVAGAADSLRAPTLLADLWAGGQTAGEFYYAGPRYHGFKLPLEAKQRITLRLGGVAKSGDILDTVLYVYGPADAQGKRTRLLLNDDRNANDLGSAVSLTAPRKLEASDHRLMCVAFSPNNSNLVAGYEDGTALVWDLTAK